MNCPAPLPDLRHAAALLPRPADPLRRLRPAAPLRAERRHRRPDPRALLLRRTTPTSSAPRSRSRPRCCAVGDMILEIYRTFGFDERRRSSCRPGRRSGSARDETVGPAPRARSPRRWTTHGIAYKVNPGDGAFYGPKIDFHVSDALGPRAGSSAPSSSTTRCRERFDLDLRRRRRRRAPAGDDPPRHARLARALHGDPDRADRPAPSRSGSRRCRRVVLPVSEQFAEYGERGARARWPRPACASSSTPATRSSATRSARRSCRRSPTCWWWAAREQEDGTVAVRRRAGEDLGAMPVAASVARRGRP